MKLWLYSERFFVSAVSQEMIFIIDKTYGAHEILLLIRHTVHTVRKCRDRFRFQHNTHFRTDIATSTIIV